MSSRDESPLAERRKTNRLYIQSPRFPDTKETLLLCEEKKVIKPASQTHQQSRPTQGYSCPLYPRRRQCPCRTCTCSPRRSPSPRPTWPSSRRLPRGISGSRGRRRSVFAQSLFRGRARGGVGGRERWRDSAGWWCGGSRSRGSSGCRRGRGGRRLRGSGWVRRPTGMVVSRGIVWEVV